MAKGGGLLAVYSLGLAVPFLLTAVAFNRATTAFGWIRRHYALINGVAGLLLIAIGVLVFSGELCRLNSRLSSARRPGIELLPGHLGAAAERPPRWPLLRVGHYAARKQVVQAAAVVAEQDQEVAGEERQRREHHAEEPHDQASQGGRRVPSGGS